MSTMLISKCGPSSTTPVFVCGRQELDEAQNLLESAQGLRPQSFIAEYLNQIRAANRARRAAAAAR